MRQRQKNQGWWTAIVALGAVAAACSAIDDNDKTQNPTRDAGAGAAEGDAGDTADAASTGGSMATDETGN